MDTSCAGCRTFDGVILSALVACLYSLPVGPSGRLDPVMLHDLVLQCVHCSNENS